MVFRQGISVFGTLGQFTEILPYLQVGYFRIDLGGMDIGMFHHPTDGFNRNSVGKADFRGIGMSGHIIRKMTIQFTYLLYQFQTATKAADRRHIEQLTALAFSSVFLHNPQWYVQQLDTAFCFSFKSVDINLFGTVFFRNDMFL